MTAANDPAATEHETRREFSAVPLALAISAVVFAVWVGIWLGAWEASIVTVGFAVIAIAAVVGLLTRTGRSLVTDPPQVRPIDDGRYRVLAIVDELPPAKRFVDALPSAVDGRPVSVFVIAPALQSRFGRLTEDQAGYDRATARLGAALEEFREAGMRIEGGEVSSSDPLQAADDGLRQFPASEIVFVTHPDAEANWLEKNVVALAKSRYGQPVEHVTVSTG
jgi:hypothetical protein